MPEVTPKIERRGGKRHGPPRMALCGHLVEYFPGSYRKCCADCAKPAPRACKRCGSDLSDLSPNRKFCSDFCSDAFRGVIFVGPLERRICLLEECDVAFLTHHATKRCCSHRHTKMHSNRVARAVGKQPNPWNDRRRSNAQARRARQVGTATNASVYLADVVSRDGTNCGLCGEPVDMALLWPHRMSRSVDHIIPISRGGVHAPDNCQLAHLSCNSRKGNRVA